MRRMWMVSGAAVCAWLAAALLCAGPAAAQSGSLERRVQELEDKVEQQEEQLRKQEAAPAAPAPAKADPLDFKAYWKDGLRFKTNDGHFQLRIGGRVQLDMAAIGGSQELTDAVGELENGVEFRRARIYMEGLIYDRVEFKMQYDFAEEAPEFKDVYMGLVDLPYVGGIRVGQFKEPFSLEELTSSNYITFMERGLPNALVPARNVGIQLYNDQFGERMTWALGTFVDTDDFGRHVGDGDVNFTMRLTGLPWYEEGGRRLLHLGGAFSHRNPNEETASYSSRPESHLAPTFVDTDDFTANSADLFGAEAALVFDAFSLQSEYVANLLNVPVGTGDAALSGVYVFASYFLTGESRPYKPAEGVFDKVVPKRTFLFGQGGPGAWELAARYSYLNLTDTPGGVDGGRLQDVTIGVNWYLNTNLRIMANFVNGNYLDVGDANIFQMRFQIFL